MIIIKSDTVPLHGAAISMIGGRPENQDDMAYLDTPLGFLIIVCDGMGGGPGGKTASYIAKQEIAKTICECSQQTPRDHALKMAAAHAHKALEDKMVEKPALNGMGSTFVAALINSQSAVIAHAGDSRCYRLHGKKCLFRSQDHSLVAELVRKKVMTEEDARRSPQANVITRGLGSTNSPVPEIDEIPYKKGDRFVICTDGVWGSMQHQELLKVLTQSIEPQKLLSDLSAQIDKIGFANGGGHDNHTIAMFELEKNSQLKDCVSWKKWTVISLVSVLITILVSVSLYATFHLNDQWDMPSEEITPISTDVLPASNYSDYKLSSGAENPNVSDKKESESDYTNENKKKKDYDANSKVVANDDRLNQLNDTLYRRLMQMSGKSVDSDTSANNKRKSSKVAPSHENIPNKIIDCLNSAKKVKDKNLKAAQKKMGVLHNEVIRLTDLLLERTSDKRTKHQIDKFKIKISQKKLWWIDGKKNSEGYYRALYPKVFEKYSGDMTKIKNRIEQQSE